MSYQSKVVNHNFKVRLMLFFVRPINIFNVLLFVKMWQLLSYGPSTIPGMFGKYSAADVTQSLWQQEFSNWIWYFLGTAILDLFYQELMPLIRGD